VLQHHRDAIERWVEAAADDDEVARRGGGRFADQGVRPRGQRRRRVRDRHRRSVRPSPGKRELTSFSTELCDYEGGYVDAKYVDRAFLEAVVERGSEPARSAFLGAIVAWSTDPSIDALVKMTVTYPEAGVEQRMARFLAQAQTAQWYVSEAAKRDDPYSPGGRRAALRCSPAVWCWPTTGCCTRTTSGCCAPSPRCPTVPTTSSIWCAPWRSSGLRPPRGGRDVAAAVPGVAAGPGRLVDPVHAGQRVELARR